MPRERGNLEIVTNARRKKKNRNWYHSNHRNNENSTHQYHYSPEDITYPQLT